MTQIHPTSIIGKNTNIAGDVEIGPFCLIGDNVSIGSGTRILNHVTVYSGAKIGSNNIIYPGAVLAGNPQDLKFSGEPTELIVGNNNTIRECVTLNRGTKATGRTRIGNNNFFMANSHVAHDSTVGDNCILANSAALGGHVTVGDYAILGGLVGIHQFVNIGKHCMVGASSIVVKDVIPYSLFSGNPLEYEGMNKIGLRRRGFSEEAITSIKECYRLLFHTGLNVSQAVEKIKTDIVQSDEVLHLISFIEKTSRGIAK